MDFLQQITIQFITLFVAILAYLVVNKFLPSYANKKGENLATKEDIGEITREIEKVKTAMASAQHEHEEYLREQRACLLKFYDFAIEFMYQKLAVNFGDFPMDNGQSMADFQRSFFDLVSNLLKSYQRIVVYFAREDKLFLAVCRRET